MLVRRLGRWPDIKPALVQRIVFAGKILADWTPDEYVPGEWRQIPSCQPRIVWMEIQS